MSFTRKKDLPPVAVLAKKILEEKTNQTPSQTVKRKFEVDKAKNRWYDACFIEWHLTGCRYHPSITIGTHSNKLKKFGMGPGTTTDDKTMLTMPSIDVEQEDNNDDNYDKNPAPFGINVNEDGTRHYTTADCKKSLSFKKNAPQLALREIPLNLEERRMALQEDQLKSSIMGRVIGSPMEDQDTISSTINNRNIRIP